MSALVFRLIFDLIKYVAMIAKTRKQECNDKQHSKINEHLQHVVVCFIVVAHAAPPTFVCCNNAKNIPSSLRHPTRRLRLAAKLEDEKGTQLGRSSFRK
jgi:hypothetical protein